VYEVQVEELPDVSCERAVIFGDGTYRDPEALRNAVKKLPQKQRIAIEMLKLREMSLKDGSAASGMSAGALKVSVHRALPMLRKALIAPQDHCPL
jgi:RNA polymerase sigma-70 factor (ECF subfamily)